MRCLHFRGIGAMRWLYFLLGNVVEIGSTAFSFSGKRMFSCPYLYALKVL